MGPRIPQKLKYTLVGVPLWLLISAIAIAAVYAAAVTVNVSAKEPFTFSVSPTKASLYPAENQNVTISITNAAPVTYGVTLANSINGSCTITFLSVDGVVATAVNSANNQYNVAQGTGTITYTLALPADAAASDTCTLTTDVTRTAQFS